MCGIVGILSCPSHRHAPDPKELVALLDSAVGAATDLESAAQYLEHVDQLLRGDAGVVALAGNLSLANDIITRLNIIDLVVDGEEARIDEMHVDSISLDKAAERVSRVRDALWAIRRDRLRTADAVHALAGRGATESAIAGYLSIQQALSAIDRMEVRGRDSAGISVIVSSPELHNAPTDVLDVITQRGIDPLFTNRSVRYSGNTVVFVYKAAEEIGEL
jgi:glucosamine--fructose-6-phosphate aminotransferase (isomerizing)